VIVLTSKNINAFNMINLDKLSCLLKIGQTNPSVPTDIDNDMVTLYHATTEEKWLQIKASGFLKPNAKSGGELPAVYLGTRRYSEGRSDIFGDVLLEVTIPKDWVEKDLRGYFPRGPQYLVLSPISSFYFKRIK
jgi:hypothetical protein